MFTSFPSPYPTSRSPLPVDFLRGLLSRLTVRQLAWFGSLTVIPLIMPYVRLDRTSETSGHDSGRGTVALFNAIKETIHAPAYRRLLLDWIVRPRIRMLTAILAVHPPFPRVLPLDILRRLVETETYNRQAGAKGPLSGIETVKTPSVEELYGHDQGR